MLKFIVEGVVFTALIGVLIGALFVGCAFEPSCSSFYFDAPLPR